MCSGGSNDGRGCDVAGDCTGGDCVACTVPPDGQVLSNVACTSTNVANVALAPTLSRPGMAAAVLLLIGVAYLALRRTNAPT
jgi:hypothetical protein